ncbi:hypothetical protein ABZ540_02020 [Nocardia xishanensis]
MPAEEDIPRVSSALLARIGGAALLSLKRFTAVFTSAVARLR